MSPLSCWHDREIQVNKAQKEVSMRQRALVLCETEIKRHCCICGGIHVFNNHDPVQKKGCSYLKAKHVSQVYLQKALASSNERLHETKLELRKTLIDSNEVKDLFARGI